MGTFYARRGDVAQAIKLLERGRDLCDLHDIPLWRPVFGSFLGYTLALSGSFVQAEGLLREAIDQATRMQLGVFHSQMNMWLSEACLLTGAIDEAEKLAKSALEMSRERKEAGLEAWALRLNAEIAAQRSVTIVQAETIFREALSRAEQLGLQPLKARCHLGLGVWCRSCNREKEARTHLNIAIKLFDEMQMQFWKDRAVAERDASAKSEGAMPRLGADQDPSRSPDQR